MKLWLVFERFLILHVSQSCLCYHFDNDNTNLHAFPVVHQMKWSFHCSTCSTISGTLSSLENFLSLWGRCLSSSSISSAVSHHMSSPLSNNSSTFISILSLLSSLYPNTVIHGSVIAAVLGATCVHTDVAVALTYYILNPYYPHTAGLLIHHTFSVPVNKCFTLY